MTSLVLGDDYNFGPESCYAIAKAITCRGDDAEKARVLWARGYCFMVCARLVCGDSVCARPPPSS